MSEGTPAGNNPTPKSAVGVIIDMLRRVIVRLDSYEDASTDAESARLAKLIYRFGLLGSIFGVVYAMFYVFIGHTWGALVVTLCSLSFGATSFWIRRKKTRGVTGQVLIITLTAGFTALCFVEGGLQGHAIAWLVSVPLCALLLLGQKAAMRWFLITFSAAALVAALDLMGVQLPIKYDLKWNSIVSAAGYLGLIAFMFLLGLIFEIGRTRALAKMQDALTELATANGRLSRLNSEKNDFLGMAAHDLKNPLTVILGSAEMVGMVDDPATVRKLMDNISDAATRMRDLITDLLDVNAIEEGKYASKIEACNIRALVERSVENNRTAAWRKSIEIRLGVSEGLWAKADPAASLQILDNLISNALKYSPPNTTVHVHSLPEANYILVSVRDDGPGISEDDQKKLFQKYTRLTARPTGGESSTGLGLAIVKKLAESMGGTIQCHSAPGAGSTFTLRMPIASPPPKIDQNVVRSANASPVELVRQLSPPAASLVSNPHHN